MTSLPAAYRAVVPFKRLSLAKSRIALPAPDRAVLALAMARDTLAAVMASAGVASVTVVTDAEEYADTARGFGAAVLPDPGDLNLGLRQAAVGADRVVAILADLPALTPAGIAALLDSAESSHRGWGTLLRRRRKRNRHHGLSRTSGFLRAEFRAGLRRAPSGAGSGRTARPAIERAGRVLAGVGGLAARRGRPAERGRRGASRSRHTHPSGAGRATAVRSP
ncbi:MAG: NTP transferase domain-containing protein [Nocardioides sp.]